MLPLLLLLPLAACEDTPAVCPATMDAGLFAPSPSLQVAGLDSATGNSRRPGARWRWL